MQNNEENDLYTTIRRSVLSDLAAITKKYNVAISVNIYPQREDDDDGDGDELEPEPRISTDEINSR